MQARKKGNGKPRRAARRSPPTFPLRTAKDVIDSLIQGASTPKLSADSYEGPEGGPECDHSRERHSR